MRNRWSNVGPNVVNKAIKVGTHRPGKVTTRDARRPPAHQSSCLWFRGGERYSSHPSLESSHPSLESSHPSLESSLPSLESSHPSLESSHLSLEFSHPSLESSHWSAPPPAASDRWSGRTGRTRARSEPPADSPEIPVTKEN